MPIYEYRCSSCEHQLEVMQKVSDPAPEQCPQCQAKGSLERLVSRSSFQLKGGGWYSDLYGSVKKDSAGAPAAAPSKTDATPAAASKPAEAAKSAEAPKPAKASKPEGGGTSA